MFDKSFDCMVVRDTQECIIKKKLSLIPYSTVDDEGFTKFIGTF